MTGADPKFELRRAVSDEDVVAAQRLRYRVFVNELGGDGSLVDHEAGLERDRYDPFFDHLVLFDHARRTEPIDRAVGVYRVMRSDQALACGGFYSEGEYDLSALKSTNRELLELGRSCVDPEYRGSAAMFHLWNGLAQYVADHGTEILFGVASFHGTDIEKLAEPLSYLHQYHLAPEPLRVRVRAEHFRSMDLIRAGELDRKSAMVAMPALIKAYLRFGGSVGEGAFVDRDFNTTDVCLVMDTTQMSEKHRSHYQKEKSA